jgi:hypothetical protein
MTFRRAAEDAGVNLGEFESECPGYCGAQDTFCVGNLKGVRTHLSADFHRHLFQGGLRQAV